jgi:hypothetical protein
LKEFLKKNSLIYKINAFIKCSFLKKKYEQWNIFYSKKPKFNTLNEVFDSKWRAEVKNKKKPIVYFIGTDESQDKGGLIPDLDDLVELICFHKDNGDYGQYSGLLNYEGLQGRTLNTKKVIHDLDNLIKEDKKPDLILMQAWGRSFEIDLFLEYRKKHNLKFVNISLDDRLVFTDNTPKAEKYNFGISGLTKLVDLFLVSNPEVVNWYRAEKANAIYFPMASSLKFFHPLNLEKKYDVGFIGNRYGYRGELVDYLISNGVHVKAYGRGWDSGYLDSSMANEFFNQCKIVLGIGTVGHCNDFFTQKLRDFDAPLSGSVYVTNKNLDLLDLYPNGEIVLAGSKQDFLKKINSLLNDDKKRCEISDKAFNTAKRNHTYRHRFEKLFKELGLYSEN